MARSNTQNGRRSLYVTVGLVITLLMLAPAMGRAHEQGSELDQFIRFETPGSDEATSVIVDETGVYVVGVAGGPLSGQPEVGSGDAFVRKLDHEGNEVWTRQFGTMFIDTATGVAVDASGVYVVGVTSGALSDEGSAGQADAFIRKYDLDGNELWARQFGTIQPDEATSVAVDDSGVYIAGATGDALPDQTYAGGLIDAFVRAYDFDGNEMWTRQFGTPGPDTATGIAVARGTVFVVGYTAAIPSVGETVSGSQDAFLRAFDTEGNEALTDQFGTDSIDAATAVAVDARGVSVVGYTFGVFPDQEAFGSFDAFMRRYDSDGNVLWTTQFGTPEWDQATGVAANVNGIIVAGWTEGTFPNQTSSGLRDGFTSGFDFSGNELWTNQFGTELIDTVTGVGLSGTIAYVSGSTSRPVIGEGGSPEFDAFLAILFSDDLIAPEVEETSPADGAVDAAVDAAIGARFSEEIDPNTLTADSFIVQDASGAMVPGNITYDMVNDTATFSPIAPLEPTTTYSATISAAITDLMGNQLAADVVWTFTTAAPDITTPPPPPPEEPKDPEEPQEPELVRYSLWDDTAVPSIITFKDPNAVELGVKFYADVEGLVTGIRFYKGPKNTGTHTVSLWTRRGHLLAQATSTDETETGWQEVTFAEPVTIKAGRTYIASYHTTSGYYSLDPFGFRDAGIDNGPLHAPRDEIGKPNGVFTYSEQPVFPYRTWYASNYWIDVVFMAAPEEESDDGGSGTPEDTYSGDGR